MAEEPKVVKEGSQVEFYFLAPNKKIYPNPDNYPLESIKSSLKQKGTYYPYSRLPAEKSLL